MPAASQILAARFVSDQLGGKAGIVPARELPYSRYRHLFRHRPRGAAGTLGQSITKEAFFPNSTSQGTAGRRVYQHHKRFELAVDRLLGDQVRSDERCAIDLWVALADVEWRSPEGHAVTYSFRKAGDLVAWVREEGNGLEWYCSGPPGNVAGWISDALAPEGWSWSRVAGDNLNTAP